MSNDEKIYRKMLKAIVEHQLPPGARLPEDKLSEAFNVSRTGIRKVLQRLAIEHFVLIQPNKGAQVNNPSEKEAKEVFDSRILIEPQLVPDLILNWNLEQSERFRNMVDREKQADLNNDLAESIQLTAKFHYELAQLAGNQILASFVEQLCYRSSLVIAAYGSKNSVSCDCGDHTDFINILDTGDTVKAQSWMKHHLIHIKSSLNIEKEQSDELDFHRIFSE
ncbi:GntR family transcriptional regulator [Vibrio sp.]|uniref:GntR family transcriptional regulator n=1 Tax=Vibrio viridaestus TaxID=2487322 RepID=A0A3N9TEC4_9VIBR|nr:GntR family transcriptional regulator [Vibrio viridaestus]MDC0610802.1 GntR family transcriptional regulator [Vibrio sp.]RQW62587.1 GntR family transcriptional regulator [Vibrio viridaestus]